MIKFAYTILYVPDVKVAVSFYENVFGLAVKFVDDKNQYGELLTGETTLAFASSELAASNLPNGFAQSHPGRDPFGIEIGFTTSDVDALYAKAIAAGAISVSEAKTKPWGQVVSYVRDPNGFLVEICTPM